LKPPTSFMPVGAAAAERSDTSVTITDIYLKERVFQALNTGFLDARDAACLLKIACT
jgi:hypothetical protein